MVEVVVVVVVVVVAVVVMKLEYHWTICQSHVNNEQYYQCLLKNNTLLIAMKRIINYVNK